QRRMVRPIETGADLLQGQTELPQRHDLLQARDVARRVEAMARLRVQRRLEQADRVVVVQRADRQARAPCQLAHLERLETHGDPSRAAALDNDGYDAMVRPHVT